MNLPRSAEAETAALLQQQFEEYEQDMKRSEAERWHGKGGRGWWATHGWEHWFRCCAGALGQKGDMNNSGFWCFSF